MTIFGGSLLNTPEKEAEVIAKHGVEYVRICADCNHKFFSANLRSELCWRCWYHSTLDSAAATYEDVLTALKTAGFSAYMTQTGGMCLAIEIKYSEEYYMLLTDSEDALSFDREESQGWGLGVYSNSEDSDFTPIEIAPGLDMLDHAVKNADTAVNLVRGAAHALSNGGTAA